MIPRQNASALHETVREEILRRVQVKEYEVGTPLPSAAMLAEEFEVSVITIKRALRDLQTAGTLRSVRGLGTFVRERRRFIRDLQFSLTSLEDARRQGLTLSIDLISITREKIADPAFDFFQPPSDPMLCVRKVILVEGQPIMHDTSFLPVSLNDDVVDEFGKKFIRDALHERGTKFTKTKLLIDGAPASVEVERTFEVPNGYPMLRRVYKLGTEDPEFSVFGVAESPFDCLACTIEFDAPDARDRDQLHALPKQ